GGGSVAGEVRARLRAGADRVRPFLVNALHAWVLDRRWVGDQRGVLLFVRQVRILAVRAGDECAGVTDPELAAGIEGPWTIGAPIVRFRRHDAPVAPDHGDGPAPRRRRERVRNPRPLRP